MGDLTRETGSEPILKKELASNFKVFIHDAIFDIECKSYVETMYKGFLTEEEKDLFVEIFKEVYNELKGNTEVYIPEENKQYIEVFLEVHGNWKKKRL